MHRFPWVSFILLLLSCAILGWKVSHFTDACGSHSCMILGWEVSHVFVWLLVGSLLLLMDMGLTAPITLMELFFRKWLTSDKRAFVMIFIFAFAFTSFITWIHIFTRVLVLLAAATLFRLDLQRAKFKRWQSLTLLLLTCLTSYTAGVISHIIWTNYGIS